MLIRKAPSRIAIVPLALAALLLGTASLRAAEQDRDFKFEFAVPGFERPVTVKAKELYKHAEFLAGDECQGRLSGTEGCAKARDYIEKHFKKAGLRPGGELRDKDQTYFQAFDFVSGVELGNGNRLYAKTTKEEAEKIKPAGTWTLPPKTGLVLPLADEKAVRAYLEGGYLTYALDDYYRPVRLSTDLKPTLAPLIFAGYGISDAKAGYGDYAGLDVKGKFVVVLRDEPESADGSRIGGKKADPHADPHANLQGAVSGYTSLFYKAAAARDAGAKALIVVTGYRGTTESQRKALIPFDEGGRIASGLPVVHVTTPAAEDWFKLNGTSLEELQKQIDKDLKPASRALEKTELLLGVDVRHPRATTENVIGYLPGSDPVLSKEIVVVGAHYDHLGLGNEFSLADKNELGKKTHYGADDNASGTASLIELAHLFAKEKNRPKRSIWFIAFSGEELGTLGSLHFVDRPPAGFDLKNVAAMVNLDMVGRCKDRALMVTGTGTGKGFDQLLEAANAETTFTLKPTEDGFGGSDQLSFVSRGIPVLFFFTGSHADYHKPSDTVEKLNLVDQAKVTALTASVVARLANQDARPEYVKVEPAKRSVTGMGGIRLGTLPDYAFEGKGLRITGVRADSPADSAGMKAGDVIVKLGGKNVENIYDYMNALKACAPNEPVEIVVQRDGKELTLTAKPEKR
ncbi:MAG: M20/M25/M40 family metallo-hydrolase [Planctomycetes bacterium]|nr:M20/M25/M40 family metallo-hydrolase [Planctomycetota bacterium]